MSRRVQCINASGRLDLQPESFTHPIRVLVHREQQKTKDTRQQSINSKTSQKAISVRETNDPVTHTKANAISEDGDESHHCERIFGGRGVGEVGEGYGSDATERLVVKGDDKNDGEPVWLCSSWVGDHVVLGEHAKGYGGDETGYLEMHR